MDKKKKCSAEEESDDLALVKAAAWAWYQHNSSKSSSPAAESPSASRHLSSRRRPTHRPSRYHLESLSKPPTFPAPEKSSPEKQAPITLLDLYEIERITRELERLVVQSGRKEMKEEKRRERKIKDGGGFLGRHAVMICGSGGRLVEEAVKVRRRRRVRSSEFLYTISIKEKREEERGS